jgi:hypothetical protein
MTNRFVVINRAAANLNGSRLFGHGTGPRTLGTRLVFAEELELGSEDILDGPSDDGLPHVDRQGFDGVEVKVKPRPFLPVSAAGHDFSPPVS